jgi:hypothetical protein
MARRCSAVGLFMYASEASENETAICFFGLTKDHAGLSLALLPAPDGTWHPPDPAG